jgi:hypothetical protein
MLSDSARDLVLQPDPERRATVKLALNHKWIKGARDDSVLDGSVMEGWADPGHMMAPPLMASKLHSNLNCTPRTQSLLTACFTCIHYSHFLSVQLTRTPVWLSVAGLSHEKKR